MQNQIVLNSRMNESIGVVHLKISQIIRDFLEADCVLGNEIRKILGDGDYLSDQMIVNLIKKRIHMRDCIENGWILDAFPKTKEQAQLLIQCKIIPDHVNPLISIFNQLRCL